MEPKGFIKPTYKVTSNFKGGLNLSAPADQIPDDAFQEVQNLQYINGVLQVDTGYTKYGNRVAGNPLQSIQYQLTNGQYVNVLITTTSFYEWDSGIGDWTLVMPTPVKTTTVANIFSGDIWDPSFSGVFGPSIMPDVLVVASATGVEVGQTVEIAYTSPAGYYFTSIVSAVNGTTITFEDSISNNGTNPNCVVSEGATVNFYTSYQGGPYPISWTVDPTRNALIWTNGVDEVQDFNSGAIAPLAGLSSIASTCRLLVRFYSYTIAIGTTEGGTYLPYRFRYSIPDSSTDWSDAAAGFDDLTDTPDTINSVAIVAGQLILGRDNSLQMCSYWGTYQATWYFQYMITNTGVIGGNGMAQSKDNVILTASSGVYAYLGDYTLHDVGDNIYNYILGPYGNLDPTNQSNLFEFYNAQYDEMWIFYPSKGNTYCNTLLRYSLKYRNWHLRLFNSEMAGASLGYQQTAENWDQVTTTWAQMTGFWTQRSFSSTYPKIILAAYYDRVTYLYDYLTQTDNGATIPWYLVTKDYPILDQLLTFDGMACVARGTATFELSPDEGVTWFTIGTINFGTSLNKQTLDLQVTSAQFRMRISGTDPTFQLSDLAPRYLQASEY